ncbi:MAG: putative acetyltransferase [Pseudonocardiales bacterium]|nr:putative acetyltransferase [Pseudonocardiales bacterium]
MDFEIRTQLPVEWPEVVALINRAFVPDVNAAQLAEWVHDSAGWIDDLSLVAVQDERLVGHVMLSQLPLRTPNGDVAILCLTPLSVVPEAQRKGIGRALVERVLRAAATRAEPFVVLEGNPRMYARFGFEPAADYGIERPSELIPEPAFQLVRLPSYRPELRGQVRYPDYFYEIGAVGP